MFVAFHYPNFEIENHCSDLVREVLLIEQCRSAFHCASFILFFTFSFLQRGNRTLLILNGNGRINEKTFTRTVKSNACSFNNIHPFNYSNATESDLWSLFSRRWGCLLLASFSSLITSMWASKSWNTKNIC